MKKNLIWIGVLVAIGWLLPISGWAEDEKACRLSFDYIKTTVCQDYKNFYSGESLLKLGIGLGITGILANTNADEEVQDYYQNRIRSSATDKFSKIVKPLGNRETVPIYLGIVVLGELVKETKFDFTIGEWARRTTRAMMVGGPLLLTLQRTLGASRPVENKSSRWRPFKDRDGVSGHSFIGAIPFITAAKMTDKPYLKYPLYVASTFCGFSRINNNSHFFSQTVFGWWLAELASEAVYKTERNKQKIIITPLLKQEGGGVMITYRF